MGSAGEEEEARRGVSGTHLGAQFVLQRKQGMGGGTQGTDVSSEWGQTSPTKPQNCSLNSQKRGVGRRRVVKSKTT